MMTLMRFTLQNRITVLMVISSIIFIAAFTLVQLNNQIENLNDRTSYQANLSSIIVKNNLEATMRQSAPERVALDLTMSLRQLTDASVIREDACVFAPDGKIVASTGVEAAGGNVSYKDKDAFAQLDYFAKDKKWFVPMVDPLRQAIVVYLALRQAAEGPITYVAKVSYPFANLHDALLGVYKPVTVTVCVIIIANIIFGYFLSRTVVGPIKMMNDATKVIASGDLSVRTRIRTHDELEELGATFNFMTEALIKMKERAENANPLTKLPGNIMIHEDAERRLQAGKKLMVIYCDLDNFKAFNDKYGIAKGDEAIKMTADLFRDAMREKGSGDDFLGHEGGDDFIMLTSPGRAQAIADFVVTEFDKRVRSLYGPEDLAQGFIIAHARDGAVKQFPIMTISLAGVTNALRPIASYGEITNIAAEVKKWAKAKEGSKFVVDRREK